MNIFETRNVHDLLPKALDRLYRQGVQRDTRNGPVLQLAGPSLICYERPMERVLFWPERDANPFFHLAESMWMLAGRKDVGYPAKFVKNMERFSDDGMTLRGAYGYRWRHHFLFDQLATITRNLKENHTCRRQVLQMWDAATDLQHQTGCRDIPCNTHAYLAISGGRLDLTACNRSNDIVWGCLGANAVHMSVLQEYMAGRIGVGVGKYYQFSNNLHGYLDTIEPLRGLVMRQGEASPYEIGGAAATPLNNGQEPEAFAEDLRKLGEPGERGYRSTFFKQVFGPMEEVHRVFKADGPSVALSSCPAIGASDWRQAAEEWLKRRVEKRKQRAENDGINYETTEQSISR